MENKINIAEILKDCPKGMELDCILFNNPVRYDGFDNDSSYPIIILTENDAHLYFTKEGYLYNMPNSKCVIFPKGKTSWEGFVPPCKFKDGDIIFTHCHSGNTWISIFKKNAYGEVITYVDYVEDGSDFYSNEAGLCNEEDILYQRLATEEEKQQLLKAIEYNGYKWNAENKILEKLI